jgi:hypothetical protein
MVREHYEKKGRNTNRNAAFFSKRTLSIIREFLVVGELFLFTNRKGSQKEQDIVVREHIL